MLALESLITVGLHLNYLLKMVELCLRSYKQYVVAFNVRIKVSCPLERYVLYNYTPAPRDCSDKK